MSLSSTLRRQLERTISEARKVAEGGARKALEALAVHEADPYRHMEDDQRRLRRRLRAQAKQLGDAESRTRPGHYEIKHLVEKTAYDQWHRLLFARFLLENGLLISPEHGVSVALEDCEELAPALGLRDAWAVAARFAAKELPDIFRSDDPAGSIELPVEDRNALVQFVTGLPVEIFTAGDSLGWTYQFWQAQRKDEVNAAGGKIGAEELPAVTQLFTEDYMVEFLLHNTLGAWWAGKLGPIVAANEAEARAKAALPTRDGIGVNWTYLRFVKVSPDSEATSSFIIPPSYFLWSPAAGTFEGWPKTAAEIKFLDPCMGSGHFPVFALPLLARLRMEEEKLSATEAIHAVLRDNIHGLELDPRCCQIGAFNLALTAWKLGGYRALPPLHVACCGLAPNAKREEWLKLTEEAPELRFQMGALYDLFQKAPVLGSLINPRADKAVSYGDGFTKLQPLLEKALAAENSKLKTENFDEMAVTARGLAKAAEILAGQFTLVATNVPYLGDGKQDALLADYCERIHPDAKADLAACFVERCVDFCTSGGSTALVTPQNWLFLVDYKHLRKRLLESEAWNYVARLGPRAFETITGEVVNVALLALTQNSPLKEHHLTGVDVSDQSTPSTKAAALLERPMVGVSQAGQLKNSDWALLLELVDSTRVLGRVAGCYQGISSTDSERFILPFWELKNLNSRWVPNQNPPDKTGYTRGREFVIDWETLTRGVEGAALRGNAAFGKLGIAIGQVKMLPATLYTGERFADSSPVIIPNDPKNLAAVWCFVSSTEFNTELRKTNPKLSVYWFSVNWKKPWCELRNGRVGFDG